MARMEKQGKPKREGYLNLQIDPEVKKKIQELADSEERSLSNYVNRVLKQHVADKATEGGQRERAA